MKFATAEWGRYLCEAIIRFRLYEPSFRWFPAAPSRQVAFGGDLLEFVIALGSPLGEAAFLQALQQAAAPPGFEHEFLLFGQLFRRFETLACNLRFLRLHMQAKVAEGCEIAGRDGTPLADLDFGADSGCFDFGPPAVQTRDRGGLLFVAVFFQFQLDAAPVESLSREIKSFHR